MISAKNGIGGIMNITIDQIKKKIKGKPVLRGISCELESGNIYGIYGEKGAGKTMLLRCILGLVRPDSGSIMVDGKQLGKALDFPESVGAAMKNPDFVPYATGFDNLKMMAGIKGLIGREEIERALHRAGLDAGDERQVSKYSPQMLKQLTIAQAIMESPELLVLDEPTRNLDEERVQLFRRLMFEETQRGALIIMCGDKTEIDLLSDIRIQIKEGEIAELSKRNWEGNWD